MTSDEILIEFKKYALEQSKLFVPEMDKPTKIDRAISIATTESDMVQNLESKRTELIDEANDGVLIDVLNDNIYRIIKDFITTYQAKYIP